MKNEKLWNANKSVTLSLVLTWLCATVLLACMISAPFILPWWFVDNKLAYSIMIAFYVCCPMAITLVICLVKLLTNIRKDIIFDGKNVRLLRIISWCCFLVAIVTAFAMFAYIPFFFVVCSAGFLGLIIRVVKNVIADACKLKEENDLTI